MVIPCQNLALLSTIVNKSCDPRTHGRQKERNIYAQCYNANVCSLLITRTCFEILKHSLWW